MSENIEYLINNDLLKLENSGVEVKFKWPIADVIEFDTLLVVRVNPEPGNNYNENVFGVNKDGTTAWTIEKRKHVYEDSPYTSILMKNEKLILYNWDGDELLVEPKTGSVLKIGYGK